MPGMNLRADCCTSPTGHSLLHIDVLTTIDEAGIISF